jgi:hypothetical protein
MNISEERSVLQAIRDIEWLKVLVDSLGKRIASIESIDVNELDRYLSGLDSRLKAVEERRGPGRPRK